MTFERQIAVVGCGAWGRNLVRTLHKLGALSAVVESTAAGRSLAAELAPGVQVTGNYEQVLADPAVRGVMIATPAETHYQLAREALAAGKDVFVEKPMTETVDEARDLITRAEAAGRVLMVGHLLEYHPAILKLLDMVRSGELGEIHYIISNRLNLGKVRTRENAMWSFAPHDIAVILRLVGAMPVEVVATGGAYLQPGIADVTVTQLRFDNGVRSHVFVSWLHPFKEQRLVVIGSRRMASFDDVAKKLVLYEQRVDFDPTNGNPIPIRGEGVDVKFPADEPLMQECIHFLERIADRQLPRTDGENGRRVLEILHAAQQSLTDHGRPVRLVADDRAEVEIETIRTTSHAPV